MLQVIQANNGLVLQLTSDLIMENSREFFQDFMDAFGEGPGEVLLDFGKTRFIDSSGIGILLRVSEHVNTENRGSLVLHGLNNHMLSVFKLAGLLKVLDIIEEDAARVKFPELFEN